MCDGDWFCPDPETLAMMVAYVDEHFGETVRWLNELTGHAD